MKNLLKVLFVLISYVIFNSYAMELKEKEKEKETEEVKETENKSSLYQFFNIEKFEGLPEELKYIITQQYDNQWWYLLNTLEENEIIESAEFTPQDNCILYGLGNVAKLSDLNGNIIAIFQHGNDIRSLAINHTGNRVLTASNDGTVKLWYLDGNLISTFNNDSPILSVKFSPEDDKILTGSTNNKVKLWDLNGKILQTFQHDDWVKSVTFNPQGNRILTGSGDLTAKLWDLNGKFLRTFQHNSFVTSVAFNPQGNRILTGSSFRTAKLWNLDGKLLVTFNHDNSITSVTFNPKGDKILTGSWDHTAKLWDLNGNLLTTFNHSKSVTSLSFSHKGDKFLTCSLNTCNIWALYKPTMDQLLLRKLIYLYLEYLYSEKKYLDSAKPSEQTENLELISKFKEVVKQIQNPEMLFKEIVDEFKTENVKLDEEELNFVWNSLPEEVKNSFWLTIKQHITKFGKNSSL